jgi:hypothetical protein
MTIDPTTLKTTLRLGASVLVLTLGLAACSKPAETTAPAATTPETTTAPETSTAPETTTPDSGTSMDSGTATTPSDSSGGMTPAPEGGSTETPPPAPAPSGGSTPQ